MQNLGEPYAMTAARAAAKRATARHAGTRAPLPDYEELDMLLRGIWDMLVMHVDPEPARLDALHLIETWQQTFGFEVWQRPWDAHSLPQDEKR